jgi:hypothetical protein
LLIEWFEMNGHMGGPVPLLVFGHVKLAVITEALTPISPSWAAKGGFKLGLDLGKRPLQSQPQGRPHRY